MDVKDLSFSSDVKAELSKYENKTLCCLKAECYGLWLFTKCFSFRPGHYISENGFVVRRMAELAAVAAGVTAEVEFTISRRKKNAFRISLPELYAREQLLFAFGHTGKEPSLKINRAVFEDSCCYAAFLRGVFLAAGIVTDPGKEYHFEIDSPYRNLTNNLVTLMQEIESPSLSPSVTKRKGTYVTYIKESGQIEDLLTFIGAAASSMQMMQVKMYKEAKNNINRKTNFETANMDKTYSASARQTAAIARISDEVGLEELPLELQQVAIMRLHNPEMTLRELSEALGVSRSSVNHKLNRILKFGEQFSL